LFNARAGGYPTKIQSLDEMMSAFLVFWKGNYWCGMFIRQRIPFKEQAELLHKQTGVRDKFIMDVTTR